MDLLAPRYRYLLFMETIHLQGTRGSGQHRNRKSRLHLTAVYAIILRVLRKHHVMGLCCWMLPRFRISDVSSCDARLRPQLPD